MCYSFFVSLQRITTIKHHYRRNNPKDDRQQTNDTFPNVTILSTLENLKSIQPVDVCCVTSRLLTFYRDRVFKDHQETSPEVMRQISSIANSFLYMQKTLEQCQVHNQCHCSQEATNATRTIHDNYDQLEASSAALKSLGELDIFLAWIDENHQETSTA
ncbi:interleukin-19 isoform X3 [Cricetulus griseus]|uniref:interleukin-19 isoform X3 n=1 Tax=Cricetulus griseus TaxID=10029 RepID=UPI0015C39997|nr:interleukin-19 isoform X3 [Cricetulus griseus]